MGRAPTGTCNSTSILHTVRILYLSYSSILAGLMRDPRQGPFKGTFRVPSLSFRTTLLVIVIHDAKSDYNSQITFSSLLSMYVYIYI